MLAESAFDVSIPSPSLNLLVGRLALELAVVLRGLYWLID